MPNFVLQTPSLEHLAGVKIVAQVWSQLDIFTKISKSFNGLREFTVREDGQKWKEEIEEKVESKVWALPLPKPCKNDLLNIIKPIGMEIIDWCRYHNLDGYLFENLGSSLPQQFCWRMHGTIDYAKTAELIVKDESLSIKRRFEFACINCLEDETRKLIEFLPNHQIHKYISEAARFQSWEWEPRIFIAYFACTVSGDEDLLHRLFPAEKLGGWSINQNLFNVVLREGPRATYEYFLPKVSQPEKDAVYLRLPLRSIESPSCGIIYWLSVLNASQQPFDFPGWVTYLLRLFLRWPMQSLYMENLQRLWPLMSSNDCADVLGDLIYKIREGFHDYDYAQWFRELWRPSPAHQKRLFLDDIYRLADLIATKRKEFILLVFNEAPARLLKQLVDEKYFYDEISPVLMDERVISDAELTECVETAALTSSKYRDNVEKRLRSEHLSRLIDLMMGERIIKSREKMEKQPRD